YMSIGGLIPHSDGAGYFWDTVHLAYQGDWEIMGSRRPMAAAFRQLTALVVDYSFAATLLVQLALMAPMLYLTAAAIARWGGIWPGIAFAGLAFNIARPYVATTLTEPLGLVCGLFSLLLFVESIRRRSAAHALVGLGGLTTAMLMRMGAFF